MWIINLKNNHPRVLSSLSTNITQWCIKVTYSWLKVCRDDDNFDISSLTFIRSVCKIVLVLLFYSTSQWFQLEN